MGHRTLHLVRHGQYTRDPELLTDLGRAQAECIANRLRSEPVAVVHSSTLPRARQTAEVLQRAFPDADHKRARLLMEGIPSGPRWTLPDRALQALGLVDKDPVEHFAEDRARLERAVARFCRPTRGADRTEVFVFHGNWLRAMVCVALGLPLEAWWDLDVHHCGLTTLEVRKDRTILTCFNDTGHLPGGLRTMA